MLKILKIIVFIFFLTSYANSEVIKKVNVINNERISLETILVFSNIEIGKNKYWIDELNNLYSSTNFELIGVFENGKIVKIGKSKKTSKKQAKLI